MVSSNYTSQRLSNWNSSFDLWTNPVFSRVANPFIRNGRQKGNKLGASRKVKVSETEVDYSVSVTNSSVQQTLFVIELSQRLDQEGQEHPKEYNFY